MTASQTPDPVNPKPERDLIECLLGAVALNSSTFGFIFTSSFDAEPLVVFPGQTYLEVYQTMGLNHGDIMRAGGEIVTVSFVEYWRQGEFETFEDMDGEARGMLAHTIAKFFAAGIVKGRTSPQLARDLNGDSFTFTVAPRSSR